MRRTLILLTVLSSSAQAVFSQTQPAALDYEAEQRRIQDQVISAALAAERGPISLKGVVVDDQGQPVTDVTLSIVGNRVAKDGIHTDEITLPSQKINGQLDIQADDVLWLRLTFDSDHYYRRLITYTPTDDREPFWRLKPRQPGKDAKAGLDRKDVRIVLDKHGPFQKLDEARYDAITYTSYDPTGKCSIFDLSRPVAQMQQEVPSVADPAKLPPECIYLTTPLDEQGRVAVQTLKIGPWEKVYPRGMRLVMRGGGGFVEVPVVRDATQTQWMREAPETGYKPELVLDAEGVAALPRAKTPAGKYLYFYFKTSKGYGKGKVTFMNNGAKPPQAYMVLQLQENGTRNLTTP